MAYTPPEYPAAIPDEVTDLPDRLDDIDWIEAARYNELKKEIVAIMTELGTDPAGASADVKTRLALLALIADPTFTGEATIPTIDLTGGQIKFPAGVQASADANTLDDYEEGTTTGALVSGSGSITLSVSTLAYTKVGNKVTVTGQLLVSSVSSPTGDLYMSGLPFAVPAATKNYAGIAIYFANLEANAEGIIGVAYQGTSNIYLRREASGVITGDLSAYIKATSDITISLTYII